MTMPPPGEEQASQESAIDFGPDLLEVFATRLSGEIRFSQGERQKLVERATRAEKHYNLVMDSDPVYGDQEFIAVPASTARVDRVAAELSGAFDRDGSPIFVAVPTTPSMIDPARHMEAMFHEIMKRTDAIRAIRTTIKRAVKVGTGVMCTEVVERPIMAAQRGPLSEGPDYENVLVMRAVKVQDMIVSPMNITALDQAAFVGERFQMPRWMFDDAVSDGFYQDQLGKEGNSLIMPGYHDSQHGMSEEQRRVGYNAGVHGSEAPSEFYDLVRGWMRYRPPGETRHKLYYVVFPMANPEYILRLKENPYEYMDQVPYTFWSVDEGDGAIFGRGYMELLEDLQMELDDLHQLRVASTRRSFSKVWLAREGSAVADELSKVRGDPNRPGEEDMDTERADVKVARIYADQVFKTSNPQGDLVGIPLADPRGGMTADESIVQQYMDMATVDNAPLQGIRTAFEVRQAASETGAKLKQYLKVISATGMRPMAEIIRAQLWDYLMPASELDENYRWIEYGDVSVPINRSDFFNGFTLEPAGTTTSADEMVAITNTASLVSEMIPLFVQIPGLVADPAKSIREILKARGRALGMEQFESIFGLSEPTPVETQKAMIWRQMIMAASQGGQQGGFQMPGNLMGGMPGPSQPGGVMGADGGAVQAAPDPNQGGALAAMSPAAEQNGGNIE